jgi:hypothetical protein
MIVNKFKNFINENVDFNELTNSMINDFFSDLIDDDKADVSVKDYYVYKNIKSDNSPGSLIEITPYLKNPQNYYKAKLITLEIFDKSKGIAIDGKYSIQSLSLLKDVISSIERFYKWLDLDPEDINYKIEKSYDSLDIKFVVKGEQLTEDVNYKEKFDEYLGELKDLVKKRYNYRGINLKGNWLEIKFPRSNKDGDFWWKVTLNRYLRGNLNQDEVNSLRQRSEFHKNLIDWIEKVRNNNFDISISGGDSQVVIKLKR